MSGMIWVFEDEKKNHISVYKWEVRTEYDNRFQKDRQIDRQTYRKCKCKKVNKQKWDDNNKKIRHHKMFPIYRIIVTDHEPNEFLSVLSTEFKSIKIYVDMESKYLRAKVNSFGQRKAMTILLVFFWFLEFSSQLCFFEKIMTFSVFFTLFW